MRNELRVIAALAVLGIGASVVTSATPPPPSPGIAAGNTTYDMQHNESMGRQVARLAGDDCVHFMWTAWDRFPNDVNQNDRYAMYNSYSISSGQFNQGWWSWSWCWCPELCNSSRAGYTEVAVDGNNLANIALHQRQDPTFPYHPWRMELPIACNCLNIDDELSGFSNPNGVLWPKIDVQRGSAQGVVHEIAHDRDDTTGGLQRVYYWRNSSGVWQGPVLIDSNSTLGYVIAADDNSDKCAVVMHTDRELQFHGAENVAYYETFTAGAGWLDYSELGDGNKHIVTNYSDPSGPHAWRHISAVYDNDGILNVIWDERQDPATTATIIRHWNSQRATIRPVAYGLWSNRRASGSGTDLSLTKMTIGVGDGATTCSGQSNLNYLYALYTRFGGSAPAEQADSAVSGFMNGELYLNVSTDGGLSWSPPANLTNTKTPNCNPGVADTSTGVPARPDSVCRSEHWASLNRVVHDIDIFYVSDLDAGAIPDGEGTWQQNPVMYLRLPGVIANSQFVCPNSGPQFGAIPQFPSADNCGVHAVDNDTIHSTLTITNSGNILLQGQVSVVYTNPAAPPTPWLSVNGAQGNSYNVAAGASDLNYPVTMISTGLTRGSYQAELRVTHNDPTQSSPQVYPITLNVDACACHANPICDAVVDILDVTAVIDRAFRGFIESTDPFCPSPLAGAVDGTTDVNCTGETDVVDVVLIIGVAFRGANATTSFCHPCAMTPPAGGGGGITNAVNMR